MPQTEEEVMRAIESFRNSWQTTSGRPLSISGEGGYTKTCLLAFYKAYAPSVQRALKNPDKIKTKNILEEIEAHVVTELEMLTFNFDENAAIELATYMRNAFREAGLADYTYGNAFKHITIAMKYILSSGIVDPLNPSFKNWFVPLDRIVQVKARRTLGVRPLKVNGKYTGNIPSWGKCDNVEDYIDFQHRLKTATEERGYYSPMMWEIENWQN